MQLTNLKAVSRGWWWTIPLGVYGAAFVSLAVHRWMCALPWTSICISNFWSVLESTILFLWVKDWETIFAAALAVAAAVAGIAFTWSLAQRDRLARFEAVKGRLGHTCSLLSEYLRNSAAIVEAVFDQRNGEVIPRAAVVGTIPEFPLSVITDLSELIHVADRTTALSVRTYLNDLQVQSARLKDLPRNLGREHHVVVVANIETLIIDLVEADAGLHALFELARDERKRIDSAPTRAVVANSMNILGFRDDRFDRARETVLRRYQGMP